MAGVNTLTRTPTAADPVDSTPRAGGSGGPRRIMLLGIVLIIVTLAASAFAAITAAQRSADLSRMLGRSEPLATAAQDMYAALSAADAAATGGFLAGGLEPPAVRAEYDNAIATASAALATFASGAPSDPAQRAALTTLVSRLPQYTALVETARSNNRQGYPVGAAYLREASGLMRATLLPAAQTLYQQQATTVTATADDIADTPWLLILLGVAVLLVGVLGMWRLARISRRRLNLGLLGALLATAAWLAWLLVSGAIASSHLRTAVDEGATPLGGLVTMRISAAQARADETLYLIARGSGAANEKDFQQHQQQMLDAWKAVIASAPAGLNTGDLGRQVDSWGVDSHRKLLAAADQGDYEAAVKIGVGESATRFQAVDQGLRTTIDQARSLLRSDASAADSALTGLAVGIGVLAVVAAALVAAGLWPRLREYQ